MHIPRKNTDAGNQLRDEELDLDLGLIISSLSFSIIGDLIRNLPIFKN